MTAPSREELFAEAAAGLTDTITDLAAVGEEETRAVRAEAPELDLLMVAWLEELLYLFETERLAVRGARVAIAESEGGYELRAEVRGERWDPDRHPSKVLVKAITYHGLEVACSGGGWRARVIFDI